MPTLLPHGASNHEQEHAQQLQERQGRGRVELQALHGEAPDLGVECRPARAAEDEDHPEGGEVEQEHDGAYRSHSRRQARQCDQGEHTQGAGAKHCRGVLGGRVELRPESTHRAGDDRVVEEHVGRQDRPDRVMEPIGQAEPVHEREERGSDDHRGQDERHHQQRVHQPAAAEAQARQHRRRGQRSSQAEPGGRQRLPRGEPQHVGRHRVAPGLQQGSGVEAASQHPDERVQEEHADERRRQRRQGDGRDPGTTRLRFTDAVSPPAVLGAGDADPPLAGGRGGHGRRNCYVPEVRTLGGAGTAKSEPVERGFRPRIGGPGHAFAGMTMEAGSEFMRRSPTAGRSPPSGGSSCHARRR